MEEQKNLQENTAPEASEGSEPQAEDVMGLVTILDADDSADSDLLEKFSRSSAIIKEPDGKEYITLKAAEAYTGYSNQTLRQYYKKGKIKGLKKLSSFGETIYLELDGVKTFKAAIGTRKAAKLDSAEFALEVSGLLSAVTGDAVLPIMEKISAIEMNQIEILQKLEAVDRLSERLDSMAGESELTKSVEEIKEKLAELTAPKEEKPESEEQQEIRRMMEDYKEMKEVIRQQQEYIDRQKNRTFFQRLFNKEPKE